MLFILGLILWCTTSVHSYIPPSNVCYQHANINSACNYGNLTVAVIGNTYKPKDCNRHVNVSEFEHPPYLYINSTNTTERFTIVMVDLGSQGRGPDYLQWMVTNVTTNTVLNYQSIPPNNVLADYQKPLLMHGLSQPTLIQILVFSHQNVLRVPFGELWVTRRRNFSLSTLFSNTVANLRLCGPVAGTQYWVHDSSSLTPSAPPLSGLPSPPLQPVYVPVVPMQPGFIPVGSAPAQPGYAPAHVPAQSAYIPTQQHPHMTFPKKSLGVLTQPMQILFVPLVVLTVMYL